MLVSSFGKVRTQLAMKGENETQDNIDNQESWISCCFVECGVRRCAMHLKCLQTLPGWSAAGYIHQMCWYGWLFWKSPFASFDCGWGWAFLQGLCNFSLLQFLFRCFDCYERLKCTRTFFLPRGVLSTAGPQNGWFCWRKSWRGTNRRHRFFQQIRGTTQEQTRWISVWDTRKKQIASEGENTKKHNEQKTIRRSKKNKLWGDMLVA